MTFEKQIRIYKYMVDESIVSIDNIPKYVVPFIDENANELSILESKKIIKIKEIKKFCHDEIVKGFHTDIKYGDVRHYSLNQLAQKNIDDQMAQLQTGEIKNALWRDDSKVVHDLWTFIEFKEFFTQYKMFILNNRLKSDILEERVNMAKTHYEVDRISWDAELTEDEELKIYTLVSGMLGGSQL